MSFNPATGDATASSKGVVQLAGDFGGTAASPTIPGLAAKAPLNSPTFTGTVSGVTASMVGLANVNNTSDANKPVSTAQQTALDLKQGANQYTGYIYVRPSGDTTSIPPSPVAGMIILNRLS